MGKGGEKRRRRRQRAEQRSTGALHVEESIHRARAGGPGDKQIQGEDMENQAEQPKERRLSQDELRELLEREQARMEDPDYRQRLVPPPDFVLRVMRDERR